ncbi:MAG: MATE family efflux transporter [Fermentimonas sp.]|jgi:MATE family multidrug resistance protein|nr:MATE family efflux transporter [Fermentimonas sp.]MDD3189337.1 MATE family efflux transporter [Fermentimonas sp.]MDD3511019.1 MATE family efflux transporter [Fermentimonas sp.]HBT84610.1 MATE family efflux transporter [Porphyromonadaceae bacterium]
MDKKVFRLALPNIITNITVPLLGMIDIAVAGRLGSAVYIGAIALGANIFNMIYWNFGFLRMSSSGFASQAYGARDFTESMNVFIRSLAIGLVIGLLIILLQYPIGELAFRLIQSGPETVEYVSAYFRIVVWGAPAVLGMYAFKGWFIGMQNAKIPMVIAILNNVLNILLSITFVFGFGMKIEGIALGTALSQIISLIVAAALWWKYYRRLRKYIKKDTIWDKHAIREYFRVNGDIFVRTFLLTLVTTFFTFASSGMGETILAVNALLMQFFMLFSYFMDGFAYAGEALTGRYVGAKNMPVLKYMIKRIFFWGLVVSLVAMVVYLLFPDLILRLLTNDAHIITATKGYLFWTLLIPIAGFAAFLWDGIFIGATASVEMRNAMILSTIIFFGSYFLMTPVWGNNGLWFSFILYLATRGITLTFMARKAFKQA